MAQPQSRWVRFKRFLKRNMTPTWAKHFSYQVFSFLVSVAMVIGVANYAITRSYDERKLTFVDGFTITAHTGAFNTNQNSLEAVQAAIDHQVEAMEIDVRQRPNGILVMAHDLVVKNSDGVPLADAFALLEPTAIRLNLDIKETKVLGALHERGVISRGKNAGFQQFKRATVDGVGVCNIGGAHCLFQLGADRAARGLEVVPNAGAHLVKDGFCVMQL